MLRSDVILENFNYDKKAIHETCTLFLEALPPLEKRLKKAVGSENSKELYSTINELLEIIGIFELKNLEEKLRQLQMLALHNNLDSDIRPELVKDIFNILLDLKSELNYIIND